MPLTKDSEIQFVDWGLIDYSEALIRQEALVEEVHSRKLPGVVVYCTHPPVVTLGRKTQEGDVYSWQGPIVEVSRGGRATYHGPNQLVVYPIINLENKKDIAWFLRGLENSIVSTLALYGLKAVGKKGVDETGVWVNDKKIASLGIAIRKWITFHGAAINLDHDESAFQGLKPCGFSSSVMTSLEKQTGQPVTREVFKFELSKQLKNHFLGAGAGVQEVMY